MEMEIILVSTVYSGLRIEWIKYYWLLTGCLEQDLAGVCLLDQSIFVIDLIILIYTITIYIILIIEYNS